MNNKSLSSAPHTACFSSTSCKNKYIKAWKVLFAKAVREEINSRHCHLMSCRELPVIMLPHIPLCVKKITLFNYFASVSHHPIWTTCTWKPASRNLSFINTTQVIKLCCHSLLRESWLTLEVLAIPPRKPKRTLYELFFKAGWFIERAAMERPTRSTYTRAVCHHNNGDRGKKCTLK